MKLSEAFPSNYLKSEDLQDHDVPVVIAGAEFEMVGNERKLVLAFQNKKKTMICNKTNAGRIAFLYGDETDEWIGKEIILTSEFVEFQGKTVKGLRVKPPVKQVQQVSVAAGTNGKHVVTDKGKYKTSELRRNEDPAALDDEIPF